MEITIEELNALTGDRVSASMKITELERKNDCLTREIERVNQELAVALERQTSMNIENRLLKNVLLLSAERIKEFMKHLRSMDRWAILRTFVECTLAERNRKEQMALMDEVMTLPEEQKPTLEMKNPTFNGPMYDVHGNENVRLED